jgi:hypothetical protein
VRNSLSNLSHVRAKNYLRVSNPVSSLFPERLDETTPEFHRRLIILIRLLSREKCSDRKLGRMIPFESKLQRGCTLDFPHHHWPKADLIKLFSDLIRGSHIRTRIFSFMYLWVQNVTHNRLLYLSDSDTCCHLGK